MAYALVTSPRLKFKGGNDSRNQIPSALRIFPDKAVSVLFLSQKTYNEGDLLLSYPAFTLPDNDHTDATSY